MLYTVCPVLSIIKKHGPELAEDELTTVRKNLEALNVNVDHNLVRNEVHQQARTHTPLPVGCFRVGGGSGGLQESLVCKVATTTYQHCFGMIYKSIVSCIIFSYLISFLFDMLMAH